jgi:hypothetical protein
LWTLFGRFVIEFLARKEEREKHEDREERNDNGAAAVRNEMAAN